MDNLRIITLVIHGIAGAIALTSGTIAAFLRKRRGNHSKVGTVFTYSMYIVAATGITLAIIRPTPFLWALSIFILFMVYTGSNAYRKRSPRAKKNTAFAGIFGAIALIYMAIASFSHGNSMGFASLVFGGILLTMSFQELRAARGKTKPNPMIVHLNRMGGSLIAAFTAFFIIGAGGFFESLGISLQQINIILWLAPTFIGTIALIGANRKYGRS